jgi:hypothetical protein
MRESDPSAHPKCELSKVKERKPNASDWMLEGYRSQKGDLIGQRRGLKPSLAAGIRTKEGRAHGEETLRREAHRLRRRRRRMTSESDDSVQA